MLPFLFKKPVKTEPEQIKAKQLTEILSKLKDIYRGYDISDGRKAYLSRIIKKYGYLPYPHIRALEELNAADTLFGLEVKWRLNGVFETDSFNFKDSEISPLARAGVSSSEWIKREQHSVKLINLAALGNGNYSPAPGNFVDWLKQLLILPSGNPEKSIQSTTIYLIPFHPRDFGCAYLPNSFGVSDEVRDDYLTGKLGITAEEQIKLFVSLAQLAGHPVIYDILPQTGRFAKNVLVNPDIVRWVDVAALTSLFDEQIDIIAENLKKTHDADDVEVVKNVAKKLLRSGSDDIGEHFKELYRILTEELKSKRKMLTEKMLLKKEQVKLTERVRARVAQIEENNSIKAEKDITKHSRIISELMSEGLWTVPGGAWCSSGVPVFEKMAECGDFPIFKHYDYKGEDVSVYANLDCQTPYFFVHLESGEFNRPVIDYYIAEMKNIAVKYGFDGFRVDHVDHIVDKFSQKGDRPISYRIPKQVLAKLNESLKQYNKHFAVVAEYMLGGNNIKEYHREMHFDLLWGNDIISQYEKTPYEIIKNNNDLYTYNDSLLSRSDVSVLKTYNNQDGEFRDINQYPGQLGEKGALFKWFKMKFIPGGKKAQRPVMYVDGDESFTTVGTEECIGSEISLRREKNYSFFEKFDAISRFALNNDLTADGRAEIITQTDKGFACWMISESHTKETLFIAANYLSPTEKVCDSVDGKTQCMIREGNTVYDESIEVPKNYKIDCEIVYDEGLKDFKKVEINDAQNTLCFDRLEPGDFRIFGLTKQH